MRRHIGQIKYVREVSYELLRLSDASCYYFCAASSQSLQRWLITSRDGCRLLGRHSPPTATGGRNTINSYHLQNIRSSGALSAEQRGGADGLSPPLIASRSARMRGGGADGRTLLLSDSDITAEKDLTADSVCDK